MDKNEYLLFTAHDPFFLVTNHKTSILRSIKTWLLSKHTESEGISSSRDFAGDSKFQLTIPPRMRYCSCCCYHEVPAAMLRDFLPCRRVSPRNQYCCRPQTILPRCYSITYHSAVECTRLRRATFPQTLSQSGAHGWRPCSSRDIRNHISPRLVDNSRVCSPARPAALAVGCA